MVLIFRFFFVFEVPRVIIEFLLFLFGFGSDEAVDVGERSVEFER